MDSEAYNYYNKAEERLKATGCLFMCQSKNARFEEAIDLYERAAQLYIRNKNWYEAGQCYEKIADCQKKSGEDPLRSYEQASYYFCQVPGSISNNNKNNKEINKYLLIFLLTKFIHINY